MPTSTANQGTSGGGPEDSWGGALLGLPRCPSFEGFPLSILPSTFSDWDFPGGPVGKAPCSQCRGPRFDPWSGN